MPVDSNPLHQFSFFENRCDGPLIIGQIFRLIIKQVGVLIKLKVKELKIIKQ